MKDKVGCTSTCFQLDPSTPVQIEVVGCMWFLWQLVLGVEMLEFMVEEADLSGDLARVRTTTQSQEELSCTYRDDGTEEHVGHLTLTLVLAKEVGRIVQNERL